MGIITRVKDPVARTPIDLIGGQPQLIWGDDENGDGEESALGSLPKVVAVRLDTTVPALGSDVLIFDCDDKPTVWAKTPHDRRLGWVVDTQCEAVAAACHQTGCGLTGVVVGRPDDDIVLVRLRQRAE